MNTTSVKNQDQKILSDPGKNPAHFFFQSVIPHIFLQL